MASVARGLSAEAVDRPVAGGRDDPAGGIRGHARARPPLHRHRTPPGRPPRRGLRRRNAPVSHYAPVLFAEHALHVVAVNCAHDTPRSSTSPWKGRTSMGSVVARAALRPYSRAPSRSGALMTVNPPMCSLPSAHGPSVMSNSPSSTRTTVAVLGWVKTTAEDPDPRLLHLIFDRVAHDPVEDSRRRRVTLRLVDAQQVLLHVTLLRGRSSMLRRGGRVGGGDDAAPSGDAVD